MTPDNGTGSVLSTRTWDVVIAGGGACGLTVGIVAADKGRAALVLEKTADVGGNAMLSDAIVPRAGTRFQEALGSFRRVGSHPVTPLARAP